MKQPTKGLNFSNLPLIEAVLRIHFNTRIKIDFQLVSDLHKPLSREFSSVTPAATIEIHPAISENGFSIGPGELPGADYAGNTLGLSVHLQPQLLAVRWQRAVSEHGPDYPRFPKLHSAISEAYSQLRETLKDASPSARIANMRYINFVRVQDPRPYLTPVYLPNAAKTVQEQVLAWRDESGIDLRYEVKSAELHRGEARSDGYLLTTVGGAMIESSSDPLAHLQAIHDRLQILFADLISDKAKEEWGLDTGTPN